MRQAVPAWQVFKGKTPHVFVSRDAIALFHCLKTRTMSLMKTAVLLVSGLLLAPILLAANEFPRVTEVADQPLKAQVRRVVEAMNYLGFPLGAEEAAELEAALEEGAETSVAGIQDVLDRRVLLGVHINPEMRVKVSRGPAKAELQQQGWRQFLVKVHNEAGTTSALRAAGPNLGDVFRSERDQRPLGEGADLWLDLQWFESQPLTPTLGGLELEYRIVQLYSRDAGKREATLLMDVGQGTQDLGFRSEIALLFDCLPAREVTLRVLDEKGEPTTAAFLFRDAGNRVVPSQAKRLAPDFAFHPQVYRKDGETLPLADGAYQIEFQRGPESIPERREVYITEDTRELAFQVKRWIDPSLMGWWSGDHHIHAAGCKHYARPTEGVHAGDMQRHIMGEDLKVGANLTWGPCFDYQKQFFTGTVDKVSVYPYLLRYDVEVSGFGSHQSGHLCLLRLREQIYPGGDSKDHWPKLGLNTLKWAKRQGAVTGPAHSGWGLASESFDLPPTKVPAFDGIGANEFLVDITHEVPGPDGKPVPPVDFLSTVDTPYPWELGIWYHTLNVGYRVRISGETDFPCIYGERVGLGRSYVKLDGKLDYDAWCEGIRQGMNYVGDGKSHLLDLRVGGQGMGEGDSTLRLDTPGKVQVTAKVAAYLAPEADPYFAAHLSADPPTRKPDTRPFWSLDWARLGESRRVPVEVVVNGEAVAREEIEADGELRDLAFEIALEKSSWVALRILPSSHTNPVFVEVGGKPIRASLASAEWCLAGVRQCRSQKERFMDEDELADFHAAYDHAEKVYAKRVEESR